MTDHALKFLLFGIGCVLSSASAKAQLLEIVHLKGNVVRNGVEGPFDLKVTYGKFSEDLDAVKEYWGSDELPSWRPRWIITGIEFKFGGKVIPVPEQAYSDLGNPLVPSLPRFRPPSWDVAEIYFGGSDGAGSYQSIFRFRDGHLIERETASYGAISGRYDYDTETMRFEPKG
ncbi:MAG: hypothetical protein AAGA96_19755 [Verrucomicrobiota bacterium]